MIKFDECFGKELSECKDCGKCDKRRIETEFDKFISSYCVHCIRFETWEEDYGSVFDCSKRFANLVYHEACEDDNYDCSNCKYTYCECVDCSDFSENYSSYDY